MSGVGKFFLSVLVAVLAAGLAPASARAQLEAKSVSVDELEQVLASLKGKSDMSVANKIASMELTERATSARLARWETEFRGTDSRRALMVLADQSAFLHLPFADLSFAPPPDDATQKQILSEAAEKVTKVLTVLPSFYTTRVTTHFEDTLPHEDIERGQGVMGAVVNVTAYVPLHETAGTSVIVAYRDGKEVTDWQQSKKTNEESLGLTTKGEFGPILSEVLGDAQRSVVMWGHWETGPRGPLAVFRFVVPAENSHYMVTLPYMLRTGPAFPAYHGEIAIDPESGDIYRITEVADFQPPLDIVQTGIAVEYAPVEIAARTYICPVHGVAFSKTPVQMENRPGMAAVPVLESYLNDVAFTQYHLFRAESRILPQ